MQWKGLYFATILLAFVAVNANYPKHCVCPAVFDPVCGVNGETFGNSCEADCAGVKVECEQECPCTKCEDHCPKTYHPVCGSDGNTYDNECLAKCKHVTVDCKKKCPCKCEDHCPKTYHPVCGSDGNTYDNECLAKCKHVTVDCKKKCPCKCEDHCPKILEPVCGKDGHQYDNECLAKCAGTSIDCQGHCPCKPKCVKENGRCLDIKPNGNIHRPTECCRGLKCCPKHSVGKHTSVNGVCKYRCDTHKG